VTDERSAFVISFRARTGHLLAWTPLALLLVDGPPESGARPDRRPSFATRRHS
jgi:hypothetical protein